MDSGISIFTKFWIPETRQFFH